MYIEHEGQLYRGPSRGQPAEVWSRKAKAFVPYEGSVPKPQHWGEVVSEQEAHQGWINREG